MKPLSGALVAQFKSYFQCGFDEFENTTPTLVVDSETTVGEILDWWRAQLGVDPSVAFRGPIHLMEAQALNRDRNAP